MHKVLTIGIIVFDSVLTSEVTGLAEVFGIASKHEELKGSKVLLIGVEPQPIIQTEEGLRLSVDATIADDLTLDVLLVPGANDMQPLLEHAALNAFIQKHEATDAWLGSVCAGAFLLGNTGVLDGKRATTWFGGEASLQAQFPAIQVVHDQTVVLDKRRITANGGLASYEAACVLVGLLSSSAVAQNVYEHLGIDRLGSWADIEAAIASAV